MRRNQNFEAYVFRLFDFWNCFFALPFSPFLLFLRQWLTCYWACLRLKNFGESVIETGNFKHGAARWSGRKFCYQVFHSTFWAFLCIFKAPLGRSLWSGHRWKDLFLLQKLSIDDANFGSKVMTSEVEERPRFVTGDYGQHRSQWVKQLQSTTPTCRQGMQPGPMLGYPQPIYVYPFTQ